jgi:hypothetical protein
MRSYIHLDAKEVGSVAKGDIERVKKETKCHRCALDFDNGWAKRTVAAILAGLAALGAGGM